MQKVVMLYCRISGSVQSRVLGRGHSHIWPPEPRPGSDWWRPEPRGSRSCESTLLDIRALGTFRKHNHNEHMVVRTLQIGTVKNSLIFFMILLFLDDYFLVYGMWWYFFDWFTVNYLSAKFRMYSDHMIIRYIYIGLSQ